jgi:hypothetical protein
MSEQSPWIYIKANSGKLYLTTSHLYSIHLKVVDSLDRIVNWIVLHNLDLDISLPVLFGRDDLATLKRDPARRAM